MHPLMRLCLARRSAAAPSWRVHSPAPSQVRWCTDAAAAAAPPAATPKSAVRRALGIFGRLSALLLLGCVGFCAYDEGVRRSMYCTYEFTPVAWAYYQFGQRSFETEEARAAAKRELDIEYAQKTLEILLRLKGYYIKMGQTCVGAGVLPKEYDRILGGTLLDNVPAEPFEVIEGILKEELGVGSLDEVFASFEEVPLGAASIGQVHKATLKDGREVVVKVQYPSVEKLFFVDVMTMKLFCAMYDDYGEMVNDLVDEVARTFEDEFDYRREAKNMAECRANLAAKQHTYPMRVTIPRAHEELCTAKVLVMDRMPGIPIRKAMRNIITELAAKENMSFQDYMAKLEAQYLDRLAAPPSAGAAASQGASVMKANALNSVVLDVYAFYLRLRDYLLNGARYVGNTLLMRKDGNLAFEYSSSQPVLNVYKIVETLFQIHARQVFDDGVFNSDPHAGNLLVDGNNLSLIDYGAVGRMTRQQRVDFARMVVAIADGDDDATVAAYKACGASSKENKREFLLAYALICFHRGFYTPDVMRLGVVPEDWNGNWATIDEHLNKVDKVGAFPGYFIMLQRLGQVLLGLGGEVGVSAEKPLSLAEMWREQAVAFLRRENEPFAAPAQA